MADTERTLAELLALWADNAIGSISAQDGRDFIVSVFGGYGSIYVKGGVTAQTISATPAKMTGFVTNGVAKGTTPDHTNDQITVSVAGDYKIELLMGSFIGTNGATIDLDIRVNGVTSGFPIISRALGTPAAPGSATTAAQLTLAANDIVTVYTSSPTGSSFTPGEAILMINRVS